jgi:hypothetical protein
MGAGGRNVKHAKKKGGPSPDRPFVSQSFYARSQNSVWIVNWKVRGAPSA